MAARVALSTASVFPEPVEFAFDLAAELGYDGVEVMVWSDPVSQDVPALLRLERQYDVAVLAVHAPCLAVSQRVWAADPERRLWCSAEAAADLGAGTVVVHPPFRWQRRYAAALPERISEVEERHAILVGVENMFPVRRGRVQVSPYTPGPDPTVFGSPHYTLDLSHTAAAGQDALELLGRMGEGLVHLHLTDGSGAPRDEHLVPGHGGQPCAEVCERLVTGGFDGTVVVEVSTRRARTRPARVAALLFGRLHLAATAGA